MTPSIQIFDPSKAADYIWRAKMNAGATMTPNGLQEKWAKMIGTHRDGVDPRTKILSAANKFIGKTAISVEAISNIIWGPQSQWFQYPLYQKWPFPKNMWIISTVTGVQEVIVPEMFKWFPVGRYSYKQGHKKFPYKWETDNGWTIFIKTYEEDPSEFESTLLGFCLLSEPPPEWVYDAVAPRFSEGGVIAMEMTPLEGSGWVFDDLADSGKAQVIYGEICEGCKEHGVRGRYPHALIETWINSIRNPEEKIARVKGRPISHRGAIYTTFLDEIGSLYSHVVPTQELNPDEQIWFGMDPHGSKPPFCQWWAVDRTGDARCVLEFPVYKIDEGYEKITSTRLQIHEFAAIIKRIEAEYGFTKRIQKRIMDPFFGSKKYADKEYTVKQKWAQHGIRCVFPPPAKVQKVQIGHEEVQERLELNRATMRPRITWEAHCMNSIRAMKRYGTVRPTTVKDDRDLVSERWPLTERWKHGPDVTRYIMVSNPTWQPLAPIEEVLGWRGELARSEGNEYNYYAQ